MTISLALNDLIVLFAENPELDRNTRILVTGDGGETTDVAVECYLSNDNEIVIEFVPAVGTD